MTTDERASPQEAKPARENSSLGFIEAVHHFTIFYDNKNDLILQMIEEL